MWWAEVTYSRKYFKEDKMSFLDSLQETKKEFKNSIAKLISLFKSKNINSISKLISTFKNDSDFKKQWNDIWKEIVSKEGGKLSLTTIGAVIGASLGGVGIAAAGGAIGLPLATVLGLTGFVFGTEVDSLKNRLFGKTKRVAISKDLYVRISNLADMFKSPPDEFLNFFIDTAITEWEKELGNKA